MVGSTIERDNEWEQDGRMVHASNVPFDLLFPHVDLIVHHGGIGTVGSALASGKPQVVYPFGVNDVPVARKLVPHQETLTL